MDGAEADGVRVEDTHPFPDRHHHPHFAGAGASCAEAHSWEGRARAAQAPSTPGQALATVLGSRT